MRIAVLIAAYNSETTLGKVISGLREAGFAAGDIVVVDDGSSDRTAELARAADAVVLRHLVNRGKGGAQRTGFAWIVDHGYDGAITFDADCQHDAREICRFLPVSRPDRIVYGNRTGDLRGMPFSNKFSNLTTSLVVSLLCRKRIKDSQCGFRSVGRSVMAKVRLKTNRFETESELLIKSAKSGFDIIPVPVTTLYTGAGSFIRPFTDTIRFVILAARSLWD